MSLSKFRSRIDEIDDAVIELLAERMRLVADAAALKSTDNLEIRDREREKTVVARLRAKAVGLGLDEDFTSEIFHRIMSHSCDLQAAVSANWTEGSS